MLPELGRVPSGPWLGRTGTAGAADRVFNFHVPYTRTTSREENPRRPTVRLSRRKCEHSARFLSAVTVKPAGISLILGLL